MASVCELVILQHVAVLVREKWIRWTMSEI